MAFGSVPLVAYVIFVAAKISGDVVFYVSIAVSLFTMFMMGFVKVRGNLTGSYRAFRAN
jgi:hypothetical protein